MPKKCEKCKWVVHGKFSHLYGGIPIGCNKKDDQRGFSKGSCFEAKKEEKNE